jgi:predicted transposase/invertase (TIGR01784 family)
MNIMSNKKAKLLNNKDIATTDNNGEEERLNPLNDFLFMKYMGEVGDEVQLMAFLNAVFEKTKKNKIKSIKILENRLHSAEIVGNKSSILDVRAEMLDGTRVNIEVQLRNVHNMSERSLLYWSREYSSNIKSGDEYDKLTNVITVNILGAEFLPLDEFHTSFHLREDLHNDYILTEALEMHFVDMVKFRRLKDKDIANNALHRWLTFFDQRTSEQTIKQIIEMDSAIKKAHERIKYLAQDSNMLHAYRMREMAVHDFNTSVNAAKREGEKRGKKEGIAIGKKEGIAIGKKEGIAIGEKEGIAIGIVALRKLGYSADVIALHVGMSPEEVNKILEEQGLK